ncbi:hypothetical protein C922_05061 [Plasmodium inui San Antonio 1]|uniref:Uncharacterized protein n=1 Tax=Plasmodium inui San Antonio 1 TaxID=1237626 RepID=W6ZZ54_9APIC|nr:hypothetical protein C922_05061 [Plasmodium inui San Antonio 1]EUD64545.1 hypothetical protein C922_05061 [Plasmodium inui San Antonio 1]
MQYFTMRTNFKDTFQANIMRNILSKSYSALMNLEGNVKPPCFFTKIEGNELIRESSCFCLHQLIFENLLRRKNVENVKRSSLSVDPSEFTYLQLDFFNYLRSPPPRKKFNYKIPYFLNHNDEFARDRMRKNIKRGSPHSRIKILFNNFCLYNVNRRIVLIRDYYGMHSKNYRSIIFLENIFNIKKYLAFTLNMKSIPDGTPELCALLFAKNALNFYRNGVIYGSMMNDRYFKEIADGLFPKYEVNKNVFTNITFLQSLYLLFKKIERSSNTKKKNYENIFLFNVQDNYSKISKMQREEAIKNSFSSKNLDKTMFTVQIRNDSDVLDKRRIWLCRND